MDNLKLVGRKKIKNFFALEVVNESVVLTSVEIS